MFKNLRIVVPRFNPLVRGLSTTAANVSSETSVDMKFPLSYGEKHRTTKQEMPTSIGEAWGQVLVKNSDLPVPTGTWTPDSRRSGVLFTKAGMTSVIDQYGVMHPVTVLDIDNCQVTNLQTDIPNRQNQIRIQLGCTNRKVKSVNKPLLGHFHKHKIAPKLHLKDSKITADALLPTGWKFDVRHFVIGQYVDVSGISTGKGFAGVMKRWGFAGQPASHGVSITHRSLGSTGQCQDPGHVFKNKKMPGHLGNDKALVQNVQVFQILPKRNAILVRGQVPGPVGSMVYVRDAMRKPFNPESPPPFPTFLPPKDDKKLEITMPTELLGSDPYANGNVI